MSRRTRKPEVAPAADAPDPRLGLQLGSLRIESVIGRGGMGVVYKATDTSLGREVAVKFLTAESTRSRERFIREARLAAQLSHPNIVVVHHVGEHESCPYIVTELMTGGSLESLVIKKGAMSIAAALRMIIPSARAVQHAHERQIIHRDIKPANLLLSAEGVVKVADFGLAKSLTDAAVLTRPGMMVGSPHFIAPDMCLGFPVSPATDVYSLGCTFYFLLTGKAPFDSPQVPKIIFMHMQDPFPDLASAVPAVPPALVQILNRSVAKKPVDRFAAAGEMADELEAVLATVAPAQALSSSGSGIADFEIRTPEERELVRSLIAKYRGMTEEQKKNLPSVLSMAVKLPGSADGRSPTLVDAPPIPARAAATAAIQRPPAPPAPTGMISRTPAPPARTAADEKRRAEARPHYERGKAAAEAGDYAAAVAALNTALSLDPDSAPALNYRGLARYKLKQLDASIADFTRALEIDPGFVRAYNNRGLAHNKLGRFEPAIADFTQAINRARVREPAVYYNRGLAYYNHGDLEKAIADFDQTLAIQPGYGSAYNNRGLAYYKMGKYMSAIADFDKAMALKPDDARALYNRGLAQAGLGRTQQADSDFDRAVALDPSLAQLVREARRG
jgi:serine/threonine protein kinase/lipoprotein NlpI